MKARKLRCLEELACLVDGLSSDAANIDPQNVSIVAVEGRSERCTKPRCPGYTTSHAICRTW